MAKTQTPSEYDRAQKRKAERQVRDALPDVRVVRVDGRTVRALIDLATPVTFSGDAHPVDVVSVADDIRQEQDGDPSADPTKPLAVLAQIPPFRVGRVTFRVISERVVPDRNPGAVVRQVELICRSRSSTLHQHPARCECGPCGYLPKWCDANGRTSRDLWYHDATRTYHLRDKNGTWTWLGRDYVAKAEEWWAKTRHGLLRYTTADGRLT